MDELLRETATYPAQDSPLPMQSDVGITEQPAFTGFRRRGDGVRALPRVGAGMAVRRGVAAQGGAARLTRAEVHPA